MLRTGGVITKAARCSACDLPIADAGVVNRVAVREPTGRGVAARADRIGSSERYAKFIGHLAERLLESHSHHDRTPPGTKTSADAARVLYYMCTAVLRTHRTPRRQALLLAGRRSSAPCVSPDLRRCSPMWRSEALQVRRPPTNRLRVVGDGWSDSTTPFTLSNMPTVCVSHHHQISPCNAALAQSHQRLQIWALTRG